MSITPTTPRFIELHHPDAQSLRDELAAGLSAEPAHIAPKFLYDALGSRLFEAITELPEYYPTRTEATIFERHAADIARAIGPAATLIDLGAGNCEKAARLFATLQPARYVAVDISVNFVRGALTSLQQRFPTLPMLGVGLDFSHSLALPAQAVAGRPAFFYPGSSIGNFTPEAALPFLRSIRDTCQGGGLLIGVDLVKPVDVLEPAYDDALGVTAAFNLNLLLHLNRLIGSDFALRQWKHVALFNAAASRIEMHLEAREALRVRWIRGERKFAAGERIHTENSYKYTPQAFTALLRDAGFTDVQAWYDERRWFAQFWARGRS
ncbi:L-histidine N(alpha)-methyltransferase [Piscinibacter sp.]|jgi:L-histidine N-alpha-methyltransferase|uniref:L-histidine N(alpha)-methyltransferase n=1 Tax=Piscinibacter sp. TaxID=1903157 RepID=UPI00355A2198